MVRGVAEAGGWRREVVVAAVHEREQAGDGHQHDTARCDPGKEQPFVPRDRTAEQAQQDGCGSNKEQQGQQEQGGENAGRKQALSNKIGEPEGVSAARPDGSVPDRAAPGTGEMAVLSILA